LHNRNTVKVYQVGLLWYYLLEDENLISVMKS